MRKYQFFHNFFGASSCVFLLFLTTLTGCAAQTDNDATVVTLEDWVQPGWMVETLASREEYAVKFVDCLNSMGAVGARIDFGRPWISYYSSGDLDLDKAQGEINNVAMTACSEQLQQPLAKFSKSSAESEYEKYQDIYTCFQVHNIDIGTAISKERWIEEFNSQIVPSKGPVRMEFDPYQIIFTHGSPYEISDSETLTNIQTECIGADWSSYGVGG